MTSTDKWIALSERNPTSKEASSGLLIWTDGRSKAVSFCGAGSVMKMKGWGVTHWMPLPPPPATGE